MMKRVLLLLALGLLGCNESTPAPSSSGGKIIIAKLDTLPILQKDPEYEKLSQKYMVDNIKQSQEMQKQIQAGTLTQQEAMKQQAKFNERWMKETNDFIQTRHTKMRDAVKSLCEEKKIDMVLIDSKAYHTIAWGAFDITQDVLMKIYGSPNGPSTEGTPK
ncbi:OmpH family outer membrane protein [bacterium]|nr:OmpH family outer membrane protein [bacterium]